MAIHKTLLVAFLLVSLGPIVVLASLGYAEMRDAMQTEIEQSLAVQAATLSADIDKTLFERLQNSVTWNRLEIMQDIQIKDVDKRLSNFLAQLKTGYSGVYTTLYCTDNNGTIVASSDRTLLGAKPPRGAVWLRTQLTGEPILLEEPTAPTDHNVPQLALRTSIESAFDGGKLGELTLLFAWSQINDLLDHAAKSGQMLAILDQDGKVIAMSRALRQPNKSAINTSFNAWLNKQSWLNKSIDNRVSIRSGSPLWNSDIIVGFDRSSGYQHFAGLGWTTLIIQPLDEAFISVHQVAIVLLAIVSLTVLMAIGVSTWVSRAIASPIVALTQFTRRFAHEKDLPSPPLVSGEVGELTRSFVQLVRDIDESKRQLVQASKLAVVGEMAAAIAHEVRTPLGILRSSAQVLKLEPAISSEGLELVSFIDSETERLNRLVSTMLDSARPRALHIGTTDLRELIRNSVAMLQAQAKKKAIVITEKYAADDLVVECDAEQITQVMLNLLLNALQVVPQDGRIEIVSHLQSNNVIIDIADNGPGIPPAERSRIFEAFFFRREGGIGLGLAIVQQIVAAHGGAIVVATSPLGGALFSISLPRNRSDEA